MRSLYIFLDDSGNFDFSSTGTRYLVMAATTTTNPLASSQPLQELKYRLLSEGKDVECFHASPDTQEIRNYVYDVIKNLKNIRYNFIYADKRKTHPSYQNNASIYALFGKTLLKYVFKGWLASQYQQVIVIFDKALTNNEQRAFLKSVKPELKRLDKPYRIYFHQTAADFNGQIADYGSWAKYVSLSKGENRPIEKLAQIPKTEFDIFNRGTKHYY